MFFYFLEYFKLFYSLLLSRKALTGLQSKVLNISLISHDFDLIVLTFTFILGTCPNYAALLVNYVF